MRCYTRQDTARVDEDYTERPRTAQSLVTFEPGESSKDCSVIIIDDVMFEGEENFRLVLGDTDKYSRVGAINETTVQIVDREDSTY